MQRWDTTGLWRDDTPTVRVYTQQNAAATGTSTSDPRVAGQVPVSRAARFATGGHNGPIAGHTARVRVNTKRDADAGFCCRCTPLGPFLYFEVLQKARFSCEIEDFVKNYLGKLCVIFRFRVLRGGVCTSSSRILRSVTPLSAS